MFVCYSAAFCQLCFYNKDWIGLKWSRARSHYVTLKVKVIPRICYQFAE